MTIEHVVVAAAFLLGAAAPGFAAEVDIDPEESRIAIAALLAASNDPIPRSSTCHGAYGQTGTARVRHLLAMQLAYLYRGENVVTGACGADKHCTVTIRHAAGEDVSAAEIRFSVRAGKAQAATLDCVITP